MKETEKILARRKVSKRTGSRNRDDGDRCCIGVYSGPRVYGLGG